MALQVWLPLNGDLHNQGLDNSAVLTSTNIVFSNDGKIGQCASLIKTNTNTVTFTNLVNKRIFSFCAWIKVNSSDTPGGNSFNNWADLFRLGMVVDNTTGWARFENTDKAGYVGSYLHKSGSSYSISNTNVDIAGCNKWTHFCITVDGISAKLYYDGILTYTKTLLNNMYTSDYYLNGKVSIGDGGSKGKINDVRIYDHCLSDKEVEEIAKGLVLHYKLDFPRNLLISNGDYSGWNIGSGWLINGNVASFSRTGATSNNWVRLIPPLQINPNNYPNGITVSLDLKTPDVSAINQKRIGALQIYKEDGTRIGWAEPEWDLSSVQNNIWTRISYTFSQSALSTIYGSSSTADIAYTMFSFQLVQNGDISIRNIQIEEGNKATPFSLNTNSDIVYDSSGYNNNGTIIGSLQAIIPSPRYDCATSFDDLSYIKKTDFIYNSNIWSVSLWYLKPTDPTAYECLFCFSQGDGGDSNKKIAACPNSGRIWYKGESGSSSISQLKINEWTNLIMTCNGTTVTIYQNGNSIGTFSASTALTGRTDLVIGARASAENATNIAIPYTGNLSDFRIYATVLTEAQIKELYKTSMIVNGTSVTARDLE